MDYRANIVAIAARTRGRVDIDRLAYVERTSFDGDGASYLVVDIDGNRFAAFDAWRPSRRTRIACSGVLSRHPEHGRMVGVATRNRLDYDTTPADSDDWKNLPGDRFAAMQAEASAIVALEVPA